jgi:hypothetical protein
VADDDELLSLLLDGLDTQLQAELPIEYHLMNVARRILRIGARRDAAAEIPVPDEKLFSGDPMEPEERKGKLEEWWSKFTRHAMLVIANRNVHKHQSSCLAGKQGKTGCRFNAPWGHDVDKSRCVELFCDATEVQSSAEIPFRCRECFAGGALKNTTLSPEEKECRVAEEDNRYSLFYTAAKPTLKPEVGEDARILHVDLKRSILPTINRIKLALDAYNKDKSPEKIPQLRQALKDTIDNELAPLLSTPALHPLRDRLKHLAAEPAAETEGSYPVIPVLRPSASDHLRTYFQHTRLLHPFHISCKYLSSTHQHQ